MAALVACSGSGSGGTSSSSSSNSADCYQTMCAPLATALEKAGAGIGACVEPRATYAAQCQALMACSAKCGGS